MKNRVKYSAYEVRYKCEDCGRYWPHQRVSPSFYCKACGAERNRPGTPYENEIGKWRVESPHVPWWKFWIWLDPIARLELDEYTWEPKEEEHANNN